jgi:divalent metal cation (Fe/Co/Zn/Cd) transporter
VPHSHDAADSIDDALEASTQGVLALKISLFILLGTAILQLLVVIVSGSVALLADTIHNFSDALTAVPLWVAFVLARRSATRRYTYGFGRAEDLAGLFIVAVVALSAVLAAWQSTIQRLINPQPLHNLWWVVAAGVVGFLGNEAVAIYRIRVGQRIGSAALVADTPGVVAVARVQLRWVGHRLQGTATIHVADTDLSTAERIAHEAGHRLAASLPNLDDLVIRPVTTVESSSAPHAHHHHGDHEPA